MNKLNDVDSGARPQSPLAHGVRLLPAVSVDTYNEDLRDDDGFVGDRASRRAFRAILADWRDPFARISLPKWQKLWLAFRYGFL